MRNRISNLEEQVDSLTADVVAIMILVVVLLIAITLF
jgi:hypothetical protein